MKIKKTKDNTTLLDDLEPGDTFIFNKGDAIVFIRTNKEEGENITVVNLADGDIDGYSPDERVYLIETELIIITKN